MQALHSCLLYVYSCIDIRDISVHWRWVCTNGYETMHQSQILICDADFETASIINTYSYTSEFESPSYLQTQSRHRHYFLHSDQLSKKLGFPITSLTGAILQNTRHHMCLMGNCLSQPHLEFSKKIRWRFVGVVRESLTNQCLR